MLSLPAVTGTECAEALRRAGFRTIGQLDGAMILQHGLRGAVVPTAGILQLETLEMILRNAGVKPTTFLDLLSDAPVASIRVALGQ